MSIGQPLIVCGTLFCLCGCPLGTPRDHSRPVGHGDITLDVSPADDAIVFNAAGAGGRDLYLLRLDGLRVTRVADTPEYEVDPSLSADGKTLVYAAGVPGDRADHICTRPVDGGPAAQLTRKDANDSTPRFSPDGQRVVFRRTGGDQLRSVEHSRDQGIYMVGAQGGEPTLVTREGRSPSFARSGTRIFLSAGEGDKPANKHRIDVWCHGHTHTNNDFVTETGCRVISNQRGYEYELRAGRMEFHTDGVFLDTSTAC